MIIRDFPWSAQGNTSIIFPILKDHLLEEIERGLIEVLPCPFPGGTDRDMRHLIQDSRYTKQHSTQGPSKMKVFRATAKPACLFTLLDL